MKRNFFWIIALLIILGYFSFWVLSASAETLDFDDYSLGALDGQDNWVCNGSTTLVSANQYETSPYSLLALADQCTRYFSATTTDGQMSYYIYMGSGDSDGHTLGSVLMSFSNSCIYTQITCSGASGDNCIYQYYDSGWHNIETDLPRNEWLKLTFDFNTEEDTWRTKIDNGVWSTSTAIDNANCLGINRINVLGVASTLNAYFDSLTTDDCSTYLTSINCTNANCYWNWHDNLVGDPYGGYYYSQFGGTYLCENSTTTGQDCAQGYSTCQYCVASSTCDNFDLCYWDENVDVCKYGSGECTTMELYNCLNQNDCENASGTWNGTYCYGYFTVDEESLSDFRKILGNRIPFAFFYLFSDSLEYLINNNTTSTLESVGIIFPEVDQLDNASFTIALIDQDTIFDIIPENSWNLIKALISAALVISFLFGLKYAISEIIQLHT